MLCSIHTHLFKARLACGGVVSMWQPLNTAGVGAICTSASLICHVDTLCLLQVIVQGLPFAYAWQDLKDLFKPIGGVLQADIVLGQDGRSRGWGTVNFETQEDAKKAIKVISKPLARLFSFKPLLSSPH